jgi:hypothetical protein
MDFEQFDSLVQGDCGITVECASECCWSAELRWTPEPNNPDGPDRSYVWFVGGGDSPDEVIDQACEAALLFVQGDQGG